MWISKNHQSAKTAKTFWICETNCRKRVHKLPLYNVLKGNMVLHNIYIYIGKTSVVTNTYCWRIVYVSSNIQNNAHPNIFVIKENAHTLLQSFLITFTLFLVSNRIQDNVLSIHNIRILSTFDRFLQSNFLINEELTTGHAWNSSRCCKLEMNIWLFRTSQRIIRRWTLFHTSTHTYCNGDFVHTLPMNYI